MPAETILLAVPADDPLGLLAASVGGARPPRLRRAEWRSPHPYAGEWRDTGWTDGHIGLGVETRNEQEALLLSLNGRPDDLGMARAREVLAKVESINADAGLMFLRGVPAHDNNGAPRFRLFGERDEVEYSANGNTTRSPWRVLGLAALPRWPDTDIPLALGTILAHRAPTYRLITLTDNRETPTPETPRV